MVEARQAWRVLAGTISVLLLYMFHVFFFFPYQVSKLRRLHCSRADGGRVVFDRVREDYPGGAIRFPVPQVGVAV